MASNVAGTIYDREELAWAAGLFDGEGYVGCIERRLPSDRERRNPILSLVVVQWHDRAVIDRFQAAIGGIGGVRVVARNGGTATEYRWHAGSFEDVQAVVALLWRWMSAPKRAQAVRSLEAYFRRREAIGVRAWRRQETTRG